MTSKFSKRQRGLEPSARRQRHMPGRLMSRRTFLKSILALSAATTAFGGYAVAEPFRLAVTRYQLSPKGWPAGQKLKLAVLADFHACDPWMSEQRIRQIVARTNALGADAILLLGDYVASYRVSLYSKHVDPSVWSNALSELSAPLGTYAVLGNHDWWEDSEAQARRDGPTVAGQALEKVGIRVLENDAIRLQANGAPFWLAGLGDQIALFRRNRKTVLRNQHDSSIYDGRHDVSGTLAQVNDDAPLIMMAHEPDIFAELPDRIQLTLSGHTHGGQVRMFGYSPVVPSAYGQRYAYGHIVEDDRNLIVSGGLGVSILPLRFGVPPEIVLVELGADA